MSVQPMKEGHEGGREKMKIRKELKEAKPPDFSEVKDFISKLNSTELPKGINSIEFYFQDSLPIIRIDSEGNKALDSFYEELNRELSLVNDGFRLGKHIAMGFHENEQADGWYVQKMDDKKEDKQTSRW